MFLTTTHEIGGSSCRAGPPIHGAIEVGDGSWIGAGVIIFPGVRIGPGCIIGAGSVVTKSCDANSLYVGSPARKLKPLN
ncbi:acyltransferase [Rhizobium sp. ZW T2_16]|uniref:acyltransferase n=1 Tax=Rhizobium sp. ZW T2_16 TaxID=3378083 RepID=UPI003851C517